MCDIYITHVSDTSDWDTLRVCKCEMISSSKLPRPCRQREIEAHFDGNLNNRNSIVNQTHNLFELQSQSHVCIVRIKYVSGMRCIEKMKFMIFECELYYRKCNMRNIILLLHENWLWYSTEYFCGFIIDFVRNFAKCWKIMKKRDYILLFIKSLLSYVLIKKKCHCDW